MTFATLVGQQINRYQVKEHIGSGGMEYIPGGTYVLLNDPNEWRAIQEK
jgi:hypothetical protein